MELVAICNRSPDHAHEAFALAGVENVEGVDTDAQLEAVVAQGKHAVTDNPSAICGAGNIDAVLEVTGAVEFGAVVALDAIANGKPLITMNAELNGTVGPILKRYADRADVVITDADGDQPGVLMNLYRFVKSIGCRPVLAGNIKGLHDPYRNPTTQEEFARNAHLTPHMAASFADGTKMSFEMALVANATGLKAGKLGLHGPHCDSVQDAAGLFPLDQMLDVGLVDYIVGAQPGPGVFVLGHQDHPVQQHWLRLYKMGDGPLYTFYTPYHLCHLEVPLTIARAVLFNDAAISPSAGHVLDVVATAKRDLRAGEEIDGIGWFMTYGQCENAGTAARERYLPMGLAEGCRLRRDVMKDRVLTYDDVDLPAGRVTDKLRVEQANQLLPQ
jgi:predicted homoserine dehydrogenase-like protein